MDHGDTVTDFLPLERERGITIQSAAISFHWPPRQHASEGAAPKTINLIDTPGHQDFRFEVDRCMPVLDGAVCILDSVKGVEAHTERVWTSAQEFKIPRIAYVNKLDRDGASFKKSVTDIASRLNSWPLVCQIPLWDNEKFVGVVDVIRRVGLRWNSADRCTLLNEKALQNIPSLWEEVQTARLKLIEKLSEDDDEIVEVFANGTDVPAGLIKSSIRRAISTGDGSVVPVLAGSSLRNIGVEPLLDAIVDYLPAPHEAPVKDGTGTQLLSVLNQPALAEGKKKHGRGGGGGGGSQRHVIGGVATVFKVVNDTQFFPNVHGMMSFVRVIDGTLHKNSQLTNLNLGPAEKPEKPQSLMQVSASSVSQIPHLGPGQIGAVSGLKSARTGDTLIIWPTHSHHYKSPDWAWNVVRSRPLDLAPPVAFIAMEAYSLSETKNLEAALEKISREDPSLRWSKDEKTDSFMLSGMGKLHLEIAVDRLKTNYKVKAMFSDIQVDYKECLKAPTGDHHYVYDRVVASKTGKAGCTASLAPVQEEERAALLKHGREHNGNTYDIRILPESDGTQQDGHRALISEQLFNGAYAALARGPRRGFPMHGCHVKITFDLQKDYFGAGTDGQIVNAARYAVAEALNDAHGRAAVGFVEPVMMVHIHTPEETAGAIQHDITSARGGHVLEVVDPNTTSAEGAIDVSQIYVPPDPYETRQSLRDPKKGVTRMLELVAKVPLKEMLDYDSLMRSKTGGRHSFTMKLDAFERVVGAREKNL